MYERYPERVGLVCILPTYRLRSAVRDVGKALGLPHAALDKFAKVSECLIQTRGVKAWGKETNGRCLVQHQTFETPIGGSGACGWWPTRRGVTPAVHARC